MQNMPMMSGGIGPGMGAQPSMMMGSMGGGQMGPQGQAYLGGP
jgi:hypothetical protein